MASACVLCQPSVAVQVFRIFEYMQVYVLPHGSQGSHRVGGCHRNSFQLGVKSKSRGMSVEQFPEAGNIKRWKTQVEHRWRMTIIVELKLIYELRRHT